MDKILHHEMKPWWKPLFVGETEVATIRVHAILYTLRPPPPPWARMRVFGPFNSKLSLSNAPALLSCKRSQRPVCAASKTVVSFLLDAFAFLKSAPRGQDVVQRAAVARAHKSRGEGSAWPLEQRGCSPKGLGSLGQHGKAAHAGGKTCGKGHQRYGTSTYVDTDTCVCVCVLMLYTNEIVHSNNFECVCVCAHE